MIFESTQMVATLQGAKYLKIAVNEGSWCYFYEVSLNSEAQEASGSGLSIHHNHYFICENQMVYHEPMVVEQLPPDGKIGVVVFEVQGQVVGQVPEMLTHEFLYDLACYYLTYDDLESAARVVSQTEDLSAYMMVKCADTVDKKVEALALLKVLANDSAQRFRGGRCPIRSYDRDDEAPCLVEVLKEILTDAESKLLWQYAYMYNRIGIKHIMTIDDYEFIQPTLGFGEIIACDLANEKLNLSVKVNVEGSVEEKATGIKVVARRYKDYNIIVNGKINTPNLWCVLSEQLRKKLRKAHLIQSTIQVGAQRISVLDLSRLKVVNDRLYHMLDQKQLIHYLYDVEVLGVHQWAIKQLLAERRLEVPSAPQIDPIYKRFQIDTKGYYSRYPSVEEACVPYEVYEAMILTWKVDRFPKKKYQADALSIYGKMDVRELTEHLAKVRAERQYKQEQIQCVRLAAGLLEKSPFMWDRCEEKEKIDRDKVLEMNRIIGGKVRVSTKMIDGITIKEERYRCLIRCHP